MIICGAYLYKKLFKKEVSSIDRDTTTSSRLTPAFGEKLVDSISAHEVQNFY